jgi:nitrate/nitrite transporter NarK
LTRALFGAGEAGCFSNITKTFTVWLSPQERVKAQGILWLAARWAGAFTPLLVLSVLRVVSWRVAFGLFGAIGILWAFFFRRWYRDDPRRHPGVNEAERARLPEAPAPRKSGSRVPWGAILSRPALWLLSLQYFFLAYGAYFYISWVPQYVKKVYGVEGSLAAFLDGMPLFFMGLGSLFCGLFLSGLTRWMGNAGRARRLAAIAGFLGSAVFLNLSTHITSAVPAMLLMGMAAFSNDLVMPSSWATSMEIGGRYAGTVSAVMNTAGSLGGGLFPVVAIHIRDSAGGDWKRVLTYSAAAYLLGAVCWLFLDPVTSLARESEEAAA